MSQNYLLVIALLSGLGLGFVIQPFLLFLEIMRDPDKVEKQIKNAANNAREIRRLRGK